MELWVSLVRDVGASSVHPVVNELSKILKEYVTRGEWIIVSYKSSSAKQMYGIQYNRAVLD
ncbi:hypothetical protein [Bacillus sp. 1NLA3E]|uniref:hypothetical protein n=1 Tax=Bacillus sp. 1NLA3E TaxID=666686 RepID=UPI000247E427|nr:hypothetical protein [Bacillus sp. 1NLA3E]